MAHLSEREEIIAMLAKAAAMADPDQALVVAEEAVSTDNEAFDDAEVDSWPAKWWKS